MEACNRVDAAQDASATAVLQWAQGEVPPPEVQASEMPPPLFFLPECSAEGSGPYLHVAGFPAWGAYLGSHAKAQDDHVRFIGVCLATDFHFSMHGSIHSLPLVVPWGPLMPPRGLYEMHPGTMIAHDPVQMLSWSLTSNRSSVGMKLICCCTEVDPRGGQPPRTVEVLGQGAALTIPGGLDYSDNFVVGMGVDATVPGAVPHPNPEKADVPAAPLLVIATSDAVLRFFRFACTARNSQAIIHPPRPLPRVAPTPPAATGQLSCQYPCKLGRRCCSGGLKSSGPRQCKQY